jgi:hypothetical protein
LKAVTTHVLVPLLGRKKQDGVENEPVPQDRWQG